AAPAAPDAAEPTATAAVPRAEPEAAPPAAAAAPTESAPPADEPARPATAPATAEPGAPPSAPTRGQTTAAAPGGAAAVPARPNRQRQAAAVPKEKKVSALDAAAKVLAEEGRPMTCQELIEAMAARGYWTSPGGRTPAATLYSALLREIATKGNGSRFRKADRGQFARTAAA